jgi:hypothetical protein
MYGDPIGYWLTCDDAVCTACAPSGFAEDDFSEWPGFESWDEPLIITAEDESDSPTHCSVCESLIEHRLTSDGYAYVAQAMAEHLSEMDSHPDDRTGRACILKAWWNAYGDDSDNSGLDVDVSSWPDHDEYSPKQEAL